MKYEIKQQFISKNRSGKSLVPKGGVQHETANPGATALNHFRYFNSGDRKASAHAFVDWEQIIQTIPWTEQAWHAGATANRNYIGIEWCRPTKRDPEKFAEVWKRGAWLWAWLFVNVFKINTVTTENLMSHDDCRKRFGDTTHVDPIAYFREYGKSMADLRRDVQAEINTMLQEAKIRKGVVTANVLNIRQEASASAVKVGSLQKDDIVEIIKYKDGWYRIPQGWVSAMHIRV